MSKEIDNLTHDYIMLIESISTLYLNRFNIGKDKYYDSLFKELDVLRKYSYKFNEIVNNF